MLRHFATPAGVVPPKWNRYEGGWPTRAENSLLELSITLGETVSNNRKFEGGDLEGILLKNDGGDAIRHSIDARLFGQSLQGLDRMVSDCLIIFSTGRLPKRGERSPILLKAKEGRAGSYEVPQIIQEASHLLGVGVPMLQAIGPEIVGHYVTAVLDRFRGREGNVEQAIKRMAEMHSLALETLAKMQGESTQSMIEINRQRHDEMMGLQDILRRAIDASGQSAADYVAPVGVSVDRATFVAGIAKPDETTVEDADAIRDSQKVDWMEPQLEVLTTDGFKFHTSGLSIENPTGDGYLMAEVKDPVFEEESNPYTTAAQKRARIEVLARRGYKNGKLSRIHILDFVAELPSYSV